MTGNGFVEPEPEVAARTPGEGKLDVIEAAPGRYARQTIPEVLGQSVPEEITNVADAQLKAVRDVQQTVEKSVNEALKQVTLPLEEGLFDVSCGFGFIQHAPHGAADQVDHRNEIAFVSVAASARSGSLKEAIHAFQTCVRQA